MSSKIGNIMFTDKKIYVGIDVHEKTWHITVLSDFQVMRKSISASPKDLAKILKSHYPGAQATAAYEAGCFGFTIKRDLEKLGISTIVVNPADIPQNLGDKISKSDKRDSYKIAKALQGGLLESIYVPSHEAQNDRDLVRQRGDNVKKRVRVMNQIKAYLKMYNILIPVEFKRGGATWSKAFVNWLKELNLTKAQNIVKNNYLEEFAFYTKQIKSLSKEINELSKTTNYQENVNVLTSIPGIGKLGAMVLLTEIVEINRFSRSDTFVNYAGLSPMEHSSGDRRRIGSMSNRCNHYLRKIFIEAAWVAVRRDPSMTNYFMEACKNMPKTKAIIKVAKKLSIRARYLLKSKQLYVSCVA